MDTARKNQLSENYTEEEIEEIVKNDGTFTAFRDVQINAVPWVLVLGDGTIVLLSRGYEFFAFDINGAKAPNKWGYDLFAFYIRKDEKISPYGDSDKGGKSPTTMFKETLGGK